MAKEKISIEAREFYRKARDLAALKAAEHELAKAETQKANGDLQALKMTPLKRGDNSRQNEIFVLEGQRAALAAHELDLSEEVDQLYRTAEALKQSALDEFTVEKVAEARPIVDRINTGFDELIPYLVALNKLIVESRAYGAPLPLYSGDELPTLYRLFLGKMPDGRQEPIFRPSVEQNAWQSQCLAAYGARATRDSQVKQAKQGKKHY